MVRLFTIEEAKEIITKEFQYGNKTYTTVPNKPTMARPCLVWYFDEDLFAQYNGETLYSEHNERYFTLEIIEDKERDYYHASKERLAEILDVNYDVIKREMEPKAKTLKEFSTGITANSLSFTSDDVKIEKELPTVSLPTDILFEMPEEDVVHHPTHYNHGNIETIELIREIVSGYDDPFQAYCIGNAIKYLSRAPHKHDDVSEDLRKAMKYIEFATEGGASSD